MAELAEPFTISQPAISKHLKVLERAGLISVGRDAQRHPRRLETPPLAAASAWLEQYRAAWEASFERLDRLLDEMQGVSTTPTHTPAPPPGWRRAAASTKGRTRCQSRRTRRR